MSRLLTEQPGPVIGELVGEASVIVLPIGAIEQHGAHLPVNTDALTAERLASDAVDHAVALGVDAWQLPTISYAKSDEHAWAAGTVWLRASTVLDTLVDLGRSLSQTTRATRLVFVNGHGGNVGLLSIASRELRREFGLATFVMNTFMAEVSGATLPQERGFGIHAGHEETSVMLHLAPELVRMEAAKPSLPVHLEEFPLLGFHGTPVSFGWLSNDFDGSGVIGDPTAATADVGRRIFEANVELAAQGLEQISRFRHRSAGCNRTRG